MNSLLRARDVAMRLNVSTSQAFVLMREGTLPTVRFGRSVRVRPEDLEQFILQNIKGNSNDILKANSPL